MRKCITSDYIIEWYKHRITVGTDKRKTALFHLKKARCAATSAGPFGYNPRRYPSCKTER